MDCCCIKACGVAGGAAERCFPRSVATAYLYQQMIWGGRETRWSIISELRLASLVRWSAVRLGVSVSWVQTVPEILRIISVF